MKNIKTATQILREHSIEVMELDDMFNTHVLNAMERYAEQFNHYEYGVNEIITFIDEVLTGIRTHGNLDDEYNKGAISNLSSVKAYAHLLIKEKNRAIK